MEESAIFLFTKKRTCDTVCYRGEKGNRKEIAMEIKEGDIFIKGISGEVYAVMRISNDWVVLRSEDGKKQIFTGVDTLHVESFFQKKEETEK